MVIVLFGVSGAGKTTVGRILAEDLGWAFIDADDFHSAANVSKMSQGFPLDDEDRKDWLASLSNLIREHITAGSNLVLACSALKAAYRAQLAVNENVLFVYLKADRDVTAERLAKRSGHFMDPALLNSQYDTLEEPEVDSITVDSISGPEEIVRLIKFQIFQ